MLQIKQILVKDNNELERLESVNHSRSFEYIPIAKGLTYTELAKNNKVYFLAIKITSENSGSEEEKIIANQRFMIVMSSIYHLFNNYKEKFELLSASYKQSLNTSKEEGLIVNALVRPITEETLNTVILNEIIEKLSILIKIKKPSKNNDASESADVDNNVKKMENSSINGSYKNAAINTTDNAVNTLIDRHETSSTTHIDENQNKKSDNMNCNEHNTKQHENFPIYTETNLTTEDITKSDSTKYNNKNIKNDEKPDFYQVCLSNYEKLFAADTGYYNSKNNISDNLFVRLSENPSEKLSEDLSKNMPEASFEGLPESSLEYSSEESSENLLEDSSDNLQNDDFNINADFNTAYKENDGSQDNEKTIDNTEQLSETNETQFPEFSSKNVNEKCLNSNRSDMTDNIKNNSVKSESNNEKCIVTQRRDSKSKKDKKHYNCNNYLHTLYCDIVKKAQPEIQLHAYMNAKDDKPFLNCIDQYIPFSNILNLECENPVYEIYEEDAFVETTASKEKIRKSFMKTMSFFMESEMTTVRRVLRGELDQKKFMEDVRNYVKKYLQIPEEDMNYFIKKIENAFFSYYVLTAAINDPDITDIRVLAPDNINVKVKGKHFTASNLKFLNEDDYNRFIESLVVKNQIHINSPIVVFTDKEFHPDYILRFNLCLASINSPGVPYLHIRKVPKEKMNLQKLIEAGMLDEKIAAYLLDKVINSRGMVFAGPSASGKTTLTNALIDYIPKDKSICCIQESEELFTNVHPNAYFQHMLKDVHGNTIIGLSELGQNGLLCDSGYFIIGECKGAEARDLLRASNTGHKCWCTVHSQSSVETIPRLADYVKYGSDYSLEEAIRMLKDFEVIVYIENFKIKEISEIAGYDDVEKKLIYKAIYKADYKYSKKAA